MNDERKPPVAMESRETYTVRFKPSEWQELTDAALARGVEVRRYVRQCALTGHDLEQTRARREGHSRVSA